MKSLKIKLLSTISMFVIALSMLIIGVWAVGESQTITMQGSVNFEIADKSLYVKDVRMQEDVNSAPYSLREQGKFMPGYINGNFDMDLGDFTNSYGSFALYFDIINTMDETTNETFAYTVDQPTAPSGATVSVSILGSDGEALDRIPQGTLKPSQIQSTTKASATIKLVVTSTPGTQVDLSEITITINQVPPQVYNYFTFKENGEGTVELTAFNETLADGLTDIVIPAKVDYVGGVWQDGSTYTVTAIADGTYDLDVGTGEGVFTDSGITSIVFPSTLQTIGDCAFGFCTSLSGEIDFPSTLQTIGDCAFATCSGLTGELDLSNCVNLTSIGMAAFSACSGLTGELDLSACTSLISIGMGAFQDCSGLTGALNLGRCTSLTSIGSYAFGYCRALESVVFPEGSTGWYVTTSSTATSGDAVDVTNSSTNASNLTGQYRTYYWKRNA